MNQAKIVSFVSNGRRSDVLRCFSIIFKVQLETFICIFNSVVLYKVILGEVFLQGNTNTISFELSKERPTRLEYPTSVWATTIQSLIQISHHANFFLAGVVRSVAAVFWLPLSLHCKILWNHTCYHFKEPAVVTK